MSFPEFIANVSGWIWGVPFICFCLATGLYFSIRTRFLQVRYFKEMLQMLFQGKPSISGISSFQSFSLALSGRVGTGNIAGVATAIALGGPALFSGCGQSPFSAQARRISKLRWDKFIKRKSTEITGAAPLITY